MPHDSCTIILNGHGRFDPTTLVSIASCNTDYNVVFPCRHKEVITAAHHNLILSTLACCPQDQIVSRLTTIEAPTTTSIVNKQAPTPSFVTNLLSTRHLSFFYEHVLSNAPDVTGAHTLEHTNSYAGNNGRFKACDLQFIPDPSHTRNWGSNSLEIEFDILDAQSNVVSYFQQASSTLSNTSLLCVRPTAPQGSQANFVLSDLVSDILPKLKIFASKHQDSSVEILPHVFLDDRNDPVQNLTDCTRLFSMFQNSGDQLHELTIAGDANIIWDACREW